MNDKRSRGGPVGLSRAASGLGHTGQALSGDVGEPAILRGTHDRKEPLGRDRVPVAPVIGDRALHPDLASELGKGGPAVDELRKARHDRDNTFRIVAVNPFCISEAPIPAPMGDGNRQSAYERLKIARERAGYATAADAARAFGWNAPGYTHHENGTRGIRADVATRYARAFRVNPAWLLYGEGEPGSPEVSQVRRQVPIVGEVRAGIWSELSVHGAEEYIPIHLPEYERANLFALRVAGRSMDRIYPDGSMVICAPVQETGVREGDHVVVRRHKGSLIETTLKEVVQEKDGVALWPRSTDPAYQTPLYLRRGDTAAQEGPEIVGVVVASYSLRGSRTGPLLSL